MPDETLPEPPLFAGEPERCALCSEPGHTHDDHWLFQHEPVQRLQARLKELEQQLGVMHESDGRESRLGVTAEGVAQLRDIAERGHAPEEVLAALRRAICFYDLVRKAWEGTREDYAELERERDELKAELRKYVPSDGVMHQLLALYEAIAEAAAVFDALKAETMIGLDDVNRWLSLPAVVQVRKAMKR